MSSPLDFSEIERCPEFRALLYAVERRALPNSNLLVCKNIDSCNAAAIALAGKILGIRDPERCVDFFKISPAGAMWQISVDQIRDLRAKIYLSPKLCAKKVAAIFCAERMHGAAANAFLKTLEEPPEDAVILLTTSSEHALLPTICGRCFTVRLPSCGDQLEQQKIKDWCARYCAWLAELFSGQCGEINGAVLRMYSLLAQLETLVAELADEIQSPDDGDTESSRRREISRTMFLKIEEATAEFFETSPAHVKFFPKVIGMLESKTALAVLNVNFMVCIEAFMVEILLAVDARGTGTVKS
jgi:DNA polymerase-3 subunit delta'